MTKRLSILVGCLLLALLTNLSFRLPATVDAQAPAACLTATAPAFTLGVDKNLQLPGGGVLREGDLFYLGNTNGLQFTTSSPGASLTTSPSGAFPVPFAYPNTIVMSFSGNTPNGVFTAVSCQDSIWDINFVLYGGGPGVANDVYEIFLQRPDGTGRINLVSFTDTPDGLGARVTGVIAGGDLAAVGHTPTTIGRVIPFEVDGGAAGRRTQLITLALPMDGSIPNCAQLGVTIRKGAGGDVARIDFANIVVTRGNATTATGTGIQSGIAGLRYPTALVCDRICPVCPTPPVLCDMRICFADACTWCNRLDFPGYRRDYWIQIPNVNGGLPIGLNSPLGNQIKFRLGCNGFIGADPRNKLVAEYIATQLSVQHVMPYWYPAISRQLLACHVDRMLMAGQVRAIPVTFSNGLTLTGASSLQDLFDATNWVANRGTLDDVNKLLEVYKQLNNCSRD